MFAQHPTIQADGNCQRSNDILLKLVIISFSNVAQITEGLFVVQKRKRERKRRLRIYQAVNAFCKSFHTRRHGLV